MNNIRFSRGLVNPPNVSDHHAKSVRLTLTPQAFRQNKFDFYTGRFDSGYPFNDVYYFCNQNLTSIYKYGSAQYSKNSLTGKVSLINSFNSTISSCGSTNNTSPCSVVCTPPLSLDPVSCQCVPPTECIPQSECTPLPVPLDLKNIINGYAYYVDSPRSVPVPGFGNLPVTCWGGHSCCSTKFKPKIITDNGQIITANRNISMDNINGNIATKLGCSGNSQIPTTGFIPSTLYERSDTFSFIVPDPSVLSTSEFYLECLEYNCHVGVTMVFLVGETLGGEPVLLFAGCVTPTIEGAKPIGTVDCDTTSEAVLCNPPPPPPPPPPPTPPPCTSISNASSVNVSAPEFVWIEGGTDPFYALVENWVRSSNSISLNTTPYGSSGTYTYTFQWGPPPGNPVTFEINFIYLSANNGLNVTYTVYQPSCISCPGGIQVAFTTGYVYTNSVDDCSLTTNGYQSGGIGSPVIGPINVSTL